MEPKLERKSNIKLNWLSCGGYSLLMRSAYLQCPSQKAVHKGQMYKLKECTLFYFSFFNFEIFGIVRCKLISLGQTLNVLRCLKKSIWTVGCHCAPAHRRVISFFGDTNTIIAHPHCLPDLASRNFVLYCKKKWKLKSWHFDTVRGFSAQKGT